MNTELTFEELLFREQLGEQLSWLEKHGVVEAEFEAGAGKARFNEFVEAGWTRELANVALAGHIDVSFVEDSATAGRSGHFDEFLASNSGDGEILKALDTRLVSRRCALLGNPRLPLAHAVRLAGQAVPGTVKAIAGFGNLTPEYLEAALNTGIYELGTGFQNYDSFDMATSLWSFAIESSIVRQRSLAEKKQIFEAASIDGITGQFFVTVMRDSKFPATTRLTLAQDALARFMAHSHSNRFEWCVIPLLKRKLVLGGWKE